MNFDEGSRRPSQESQGEPRKAKKKGKVKEAAPRELLAFFSVNPRELGSRSRFSLP